MLRIKVDKARDLSKDLFGSNDPFVQLALCKKNNESNIIELVKTPTIKKSTSPNFNIDFIFNVVPKEHKLLIDLFYENKIVSIHMFLKTKYRTLFYRVIFHKMTDKEWFGRPCQLTDGQ